MELGQILPQYKLHGYNQHYRNKKRPTYPARKPSSAFYFTRVWAAEQTDKIIKTLLSNMSMFILCAPDWKINSSKASDSKIKKQLIMCYQGQKSYPGGDNKKAEEDYQIRSQHQQQKQVKCNTGNLHDTSKQSTPSTIDCYPLLSSSITSIFQEWLYGHDHFLKGPRHLQLGDTFTLYAGVLHFLSLSTFSLSSFTSSTFSPSFSLHLVEINYFFSF